MSRIAPIDPAAANAPHLLKEIEAAFGSVPNIFKTYAHYPPLLEANWNKVKAVLMAGELPRKVKEAIAIVVSSDNGCAYCVAAHTMALRSIGVNDEEIGAIQRDIEQANFSDAHKALINFARSANSDPLRIPASQFEQLRQAGISDGQIVEALGVMELFAGFNKFLDALQVDVDF